MLNLKLDCGLLPFFPNLFPIFEISFCVKKDNERINRVKGNTNIEFLFNAFC